MHILEIVFNVSFFLCQQSIFYLSHPFLLSPLSPSFSFLLSLSSQPSLLPFAFIAIYQVYFSHIKPFTCNQYPTFWARRGCRSCVAINNKVRLMLRLAWTKERYVAHELITFPCVRPFRHAQVLLIHRLWICNNLRPPVGQKPLV